MLFSRAYWVSKSIIAWDVDVGDGSCFLFASKTAALSIVDDGVEGINFTNDYLLNMVV